MTCVHCGKPIERNPNNDLFFSHVVGPGSRLNRCQSADVPYGMEAHPADVPCPQWCLGSKDN